MIVFSFLGMATYSFIPSLFNFVTALILLRWYADKVRSDMFFRGEIVPDCCGPGAYPCLAITGDGAFLMTGTGIVPPNDFTLLSSDEIWIEIAGVGQLVNTVA